ncbi:MAG: multifunctional oxoglutarate decarboxylase/oxoglutarate dehydrogenase thiamine pyrophosphate-binding subunit/dihydrolipoyllysine-residue succinyltransferase subunit, partial [Actinomycetota bacterium]|nr:multifunctional oxoglutarate decarboxylase/oxoglutarate dehydrogenase thiamine pyrophosphate-binding subunit/dihydrolipoyllysine-residue succinyltransferase subunit [Actinomycetota bacterium]
MADISREEFGPNTWLVEELYRQYKEDPQSVSETWRDFFEDYEPSAPAPGDGASQRSTPDSGGPEERTAEGGGRGPAEQRTMTTAQPAATEHPAAPAGGIGAAEARPAADAKPLTGIAATIARNMEASLEVPTATSVRTVSAKLLEVNREILNRHLQRQQGGKVSFTHLIAFAVARALGETPWMNVTYQEIDGKPHVVRHEHVNLGLAVDVKRPDGTRALLVPNIKNAETLGFAAFHRAYEEMIDKVNRNKLTPEDFAGTTVTITNPGMIGTVQSVPRLMAEQAAIIGVGSIAYPAEFAGADPDTLAELGIGKVLTLTSTYDHRVIQGALSGEFLARVEHMLLGHEVFYERIFRSMGVPYVPVQWRQDQRPERDSLDEADQHMALRQLIQMYRVRGHLIADLDPLEQKPPHLHPELDPATYGFTIWDLDRKFPTGDFGREREMKLRDILSLLRDAYCRTATVEYMHIQEPEQKAWIQERVEGIDTTLPREDKLRILSKLGESEALETFLHKKYLGHKRFSIEGGESVIPMLDAILSRAADDGLPESVLGMAHRGRLDVLTSLLGKSFSQIFQEFEGYVDPNQPYGSGDVKYHLGAEGKHASPDGNQILVTLASNPSHLESVDPVVQGVARAKQDLLDRGPEAPVLPILLHGDAAFAGQGVVAETFAMSALHGYGTGGTIHIIVNNQVGFTTGSDYGRSSTYASDVAKMVQAP